MLVCKEYFRVVGVVDLGIVFISFVSIGVFMVNCFLYCCRILYIICFLNMLFGRAKYIYLKM